MAQITTIIPTYRRPKLLARAIHSALTQTYTDLQVMVLDNASGDETAALVAELASEDPRVKYHCQSENVGPMANFQYGLQHVETPFFSFLSDDDLLLPEFYSSAYQALKEHPDCMFAACGVLQISPAGEFYGMPVAHWPEGHYRVPEGLLAMLKYGHPEWTGILFRHTIVEEIGYLDLKTSYASDLDYILRAASRSAFMLAHRPGAIFSLQPISPEAGNTYSFDLIWPGWPRMIQHLMDEPHLTPDVKKEVREILENRFRDDLLMLGIRYLNQRRTEDAQKAQQVLLHAYKYRLQAALLQVFIWFHKAIGSDRSFTFWNFCRRAWKRVRKQTKPAASDSFDVTPYLKYLQYPTLESKKEGSP